MVFSEEDKALIKNLYRIKGYGPQKLMSGFPGYFLGKTGKGVA